MIRAITRLRSISRTWPAAVLMTSSLLSWPFGTAMAADTVDPDRFHALTQELRCVVCQNESLADSNAAIALDLKREIREQMAEGKSDADIRQFLIARYGNFITYRPPTDASTLLLWAGPALLAALAAGLLWRPFRQRQTRTPLTPVEARSLEDTDGNPDT